MKNPKDKIVNKEELLAIVATHRSKGTPIIFSNGCFDLLHIGHLNTLWHAKDIGGVLIVGINTDKSIKSFKGKDRPVVPEDERAFLIASSFFVDYVVLFDEESVLSLVKEIKPDYIVKGGTYTIHQVVGWEYVKSYGGHVVVVPPIPDKSTTLTINSIANQLF